MGSICVKAYYNSLKPLHNSTIYVAKSKLTGPLKAWILIGWPLIPFTLIVHAISAIVVSWGKGLMVCRLPQQLNVNDPSSDPGSKWSNRGLYVI